MDVYPPGNASYDMLNGESLGTRQWQKSRYNATMIFDFSDAGDAPC